MLVDSRYKVFEESLHNFYRIRNLQMYRVLILKLLVDSTNSRFSNFSWKFHKLAYFGAIFSYLLVQAKITNKVKKN